MPYISNTDREREEMLKEIGVSKFEELVVDIPEKFRLKELMNLDAPMSELELSKRVFALTGKNKCTNVFNSFMGGGIYEHFIPAAVDTIISRPEFLTAYTPYQAEVSQGTLQAIYEYQSMICDLTGMEISNAGMYDGASATAEAIIMSIRKTRKSKAIIAGTINPRYKEVIKSYTEGLGIEIEYVPAVNGIIKPEDIEKAICEKTSCVVMQTPNYFGNFEDMFAMDEIIHKTKALFIAVVDPTSLAVMNAPCEYNADIVVGEGQALGNKPYFGGPLFGFLATKMEYNRMMPGRIVGETVDADGKRAFALTLQAREQHIRRDKATSNICSNQALCVLAATVYMSLLGKAGLLEIANQSATKAKYLADGISKIDGYSLAFNHPFFKEFTIKTPMKASVLKDKLLKKNIFAGIDLAEIGEENMLLIAVTEKKSKNDLDAFITALKEVNND
ncbi:MAG TPA: aminomethyl-transferring glycine dehydrogenase subunit GcvPA [Candidatus Cloacimonadota bacterium]|nr:aminomethyl-transferring glycine dehydrogenase subunit GcvPA [Candidatus Cloacimonadota bacterium]HQB41706.1 aminomethyl-transferring glycine dehydrogenase subunit GcvPA [Candidatus Cloacimonadota bacterium]